MSLNYLLRSAIYGFVGIGILFLPIACEASDISPSAVIAHAMQYNGQTIRVSGTIEDFEIKVSHRGNTYETFKLCGNTDCLNVFAWGQASHNDGEKITLSGVFYQVKHVGRYTFYDELDIGP